MIIYVLVYLLIINAIAFMLMLIDKKKATRRKRRIPEYLFFALAVIGGSIGILAGMDIIRHKTRHQRFTMGIPLILAFQLAIVLFLFFYL